jgi:hypothetical protein
VSWAVALKKGFEPRLYRYSPEDIPVGQFEAVLDFKIWANKILGINCYFTAKDLARKFLLTVYCQPNGLYLIGGNGLDFTTCPLRANYHVKLVVNIVDGSNSVSFVNAALAR